MDDLQNLRRSIKDYQWHSSEDHMASSRLRRQARSYDLDDDDDDYDAHLHFTLSDIGNESVVRGHSLERSPPTGER
ncbi:unnamed protein product [Heligmosomoides polygyrus]|uniref:Uncharacterized protein n=1 Tax=Heligmosomoides polygyrus TaxID=6339 RepID=A0A183FD18_HELPZ|nr:unnamed protein product [Heligmosomoides polygyrus]